MKRIVIQLSELSHENWNYIYRFIERCLGSKQFRKTDFDAMQNNEIKIGIDDNPTNYDVCSIIDKGIRELRYEELAESGDYVFNIIYVKTDEREEFSDFVRFFLLKKKYAGRLTLGINLGVFKNDNAFNKYKFQLGFFFFFIKNRKPDFGKNSLYIIYSEGTSLRTTVIPYMNDSAVPDYEKASPFIFPLIPINRNTFSIFNTHDISDNNRIKAYVENSIINSKKKRELKNKHIETESCRSLFEEWFVVSYLASDSKAKTTAILSYCDNIRELVQNIIFHTKEQQGLLYIVFNKKEKVSSTLHNKIPEFDSYDIDQRFVEIGVFDYNKMGIVDTFSLSHNIELFDAHLKLDDFLDPKKILPDEAEYISMRFAAHLGIKTFVASVMYHKGFFRVESNKSIGYNKSGKYSDNKERFENHGAGIVKLSAINDVDGTHYEVVLPPIGESSSYTSTPIGLQPSSVSNILKSRLKGTNKRELIKEIQFDTKFNLQFSGEENERTKIGGSEDNNALKQKQEDAIIAIGEQILEKASQHLNLGEQQVALDFSTLIAEGGIYYTQFLKLLAYFQPMQQQSGCIIFTQIEEVIIDKLCHQLDGLIYRLDERGHPIWSDDHPIVLIGKAGTTRILAGKTKEEMIYVNHGINLLYITQSPFPENEKGIPIQLDKSRSDILQKLIKLYDCYIDSEKAGLPVFISRVDNLLEKQLGSVGLGCRVDIPTKIGSKLYLDNYYEADFLFQNNFFTDRFAYFIAKEIITMWNERADHMGEKLVLIGYNPYSAPLAERVKEYVNDYEKEKENPDLITDIVIAKERDKEKGLVFKMSKLQADRFLNKQYRFITIVPIASTLSTTDKIIALFSKELNDYFAQKKKKSSFHVSQIMEKPDIEFVYNHVTILVRHKINSQPNKIEIGRNWKENGIARHTIRTLYRKNNLNGEGIKVHYLIEKEGVWHELISGVANNNEFAHNVLVDNEHFVSKGTFPAEDWQYETYINKTKNASLNTEEKFGFPNVAIPSLEEIKSKLSLPDDYDTIRAMNEYYRDSVLKLYEIRDYIYFGHIIHDGSHHRFYFDIEQLFSATSSLSQTLSQASQSKNTKKYSNSFQQLNAFEGQTEQIDNCYYPHLHHWLEQFNLSSNNTLNIIITPDYDYESGFISTINQKVFGDNAFVIYLNIKHPLQNNKLKLSYLKSITKFQETKYYFVDQALLTGNTYNNTKSYMASILGDYNFKFDGIITVINRLSKDKYKEIQQGLKTEQGVYSFLHFFVLPSRELENNCSLCDFHNLFTILNDYSVNEDCNREIERNRLKFTPQIYSHYFDEKETNYNNDSRKAIRKISNSQVYWLRMIWKHRLFYELGQIAEKERKDGKAISKEQVYYHLRELYNNEDPELNGTREDSLNNKVSFLKAITFPPLSQYVLIRYSAHRLQLEALHELLQKQDPDYNDLNLLLVLLKHLAILGSNALVRKDVIIQSWRLYFRVFENNQKRHIKRAEKSFPLRFVFFIKLATYKDEAKSLWLGELLRRGKEMAITSSQNKITTKKTELYNSFFQTFDEDLIKANEESNEELSKCIKEYKEVFLPLLFYDNTAITRKTLNNFVMALEKDSNLKKLFYEEDRKEGKEVLRPFTSENSNHAFSGKSNLADIIKYFKGKIDQEYYYAWFRLFIDKENKTPDGIPILEKFVYVLYERLLLMDLTDSSTKNSKPFDQNANDLLEVAAKVMDADAAFLSIKKGINELPCVLARYNTDIEETDISNCYGTKLLQEEIDSKKRQPFVILKDLSHQGEQELKGKSFNRATYLMLNNSGEKNRSQSTIIGVVTFLYNDKDLIDAQNDWNNEPDGKKKRKANFKITATHDRFMKNAQESGRLLLLLKPQMDKYVRHVDDEKQFEVWKEKEKFKKKYKAMWSESDHAFKNLIEPDIEKLDSYEKVPKSWYRLANIIITNIYVIFEHDRNYTFEGKFFEDYALSEVLESKFEKLIEESPYWSKKEYRGCITKSKSGDNHSTIFKYDDDFDPKIIIHTNKFLLQSFVYMCVYNAFYHERNGEKTVSITISKDDQGVFIEIVNDFPGWSQEKFNDLKAKFDNRYNPKEPNTWESIFDNFGEGITISTIRKCYKSSFHFIQKRIEDQDVFCFSSKIYPDRKE